MTSRRVGFSSGSEASRHTVTSTGATTSRTLADRFADAASAQDFAYNGAAMSAAVTAYSASHIATQSTVTTPQLWLRRIDNSPAAPGAGILNAYLAPQLRLEMVTQSGGVTGAQTPLLVYAPGIKGKNMTTITAPVVGNGAAQTIAVGDSSVFTVGETAMVDINQGTPTESVTITQIPDATHVRGIFTKNHDAGARIGVLSKGDKIGIGCAMHDQAGNSDSVFCQNLNVTGFGTEQLAIVGSEIDVTNASTRDPGMYYGDRAGVFYSGLSLYAAGSRDVTTAIGVGSENVSSGWKIGLDVESAKNVGIVLGNGSGAIPTGIAIQGVTGTGIAIGSNQTKATNPAFILSDPTVGILLTARGTAGSVASNLIRFEELIAGAPHTWDVQAAAAQLRFLRDGTWQGGAVNTDGSFSTQSRFSLRDASNTEIGSWVNSAGTPVLTSTVWNAGFSGVASSGHARLPTSGAVMFRNNANNGDVNGIQKDATDVVSVGDTAGIKMAGGPLQTYGAAAPVAGTHSRGEIVWNNAPAAGGYVGWICTAAGTPGTWKTFGAISP